MKKCLSFISVAMLCAACSSKIEQPDPGKGLGEIYLTAPAGSRTVAVNLDGLWRVSAVEDWIGLDVNGRDGNGAFTFSYTSNESDFSKVNPTRLGHIIIQSLGTMKADTLYLRQQGAPDGKEYESRNNSSYIEFMDAPLVRKTIIYADLDGADDASEVSAWISGLGADVLAAVCPASLAEGLATQFDGHFVRKGNLMVICPAAVPEEVSSTLSPASLTVMDGDVKYVVSDFGQAASASRYSQISALLADGYNAPLSTGKWVIGGTFWYCSAMESGYPMTPSWYPSDTSDPAFDADLYAWKNNLLDCVWMVSRDYTPTYTDAEGRSWRPSYVYASTEAWNAVTSVEVLDYPSDGMKHKPVKVTLKY